MHARTTAGFRSGPIVRTVRFIRGSVIRAHRCGGIGSWDAPVVDEHPLVLVARRLANSNICELIRHTGPQKQKPTKGSNEGSISCILRISGERQRRYTFTIHFRIEDTLHTLRALVLRDAEHLAGPLPFHCTPPLKLPRTLRGSFSFAASPHTSRAPYPHKVLPR